MRRITGISILAGLVSCSGCVGRGSLDALAEFAPTPAPSEIPLKEPARGVPVRSASFRPAGTEVESPIRQFSQLGDESDSSWSWLRPASMPNANEIAMEAATPLPEPQTAPASAPIPEPVTTESLAEATTTVRLDLSSALAAIGGQTPAVGFAQWRVQQAYASLDQARVLWLPYQ